MKGAEVLTSGCFYCSFTSNGSRLKNVRRRARFALCLDNRDLGPLQRSLLWREETEAIKVALPTVTCFTIPASSNGDHHHLKSNKKYLLSALLILYFLLLHYFIIIYYTCGGWRNRRKGTEPDLGRVLAIGVLLTVSNAVTPIIRCQTTAP